MAMTLNELRRAGLEALKEKLSPVDFVRFLQQYEMGYGDYTSERKNWLNQLDKKEFLQQVRESQSQ